MDMLSILNRHYPLRCTDIALHRDGGSMTYIVSSVMGRFFLRAVRAVFMDTALQAVAVHLFLMAQNIPVPRIVLTNDGQPYVRTGENEGFILYEYINGGAPLPADTEAVGVLTARFHNALQNYPKPLVRRDKQYFIGRYLDILRSKKHTLLEAYTRLGDWLWEQVEGLPMGIGHGDLYSGNILRDKNGGLYMLDFDTVCHTFPVYDAALFCNETNYFEYGDEGVAKTKAKLQAFLKGYSIHRAFSKEEEQAVYRCIAISHFQIQATIVEIYGVDCNEADFEEVQFEWLTQFLRQAAIETGTDLPGLL